MLARHSNIKRSLASQQLYVMPYVYYVTMSCLLCYYVLRLLCYYVLRLLCYYVLCLLCYYVFYYSVLRELGILIEVGLPLLQEGFSSLLCLVKCIVEHGGIAGEFLYASLSVELSIESSLHHTDGER